MKKDFPEELSENELVLKNIKKRVNDIAEVIRTLGEMPESDIVTVPAKLPFHKVKQITPNVVMDYYVLKKNVVRTVLHEQSFDIYENRMILNHLKSLMRQLELLERVNQLENNSDEKKKKDEIVGKKGKKYTPEEFQKELSRTKKLLQNMMESPMFCGLRSTQERLHSSNLFANHKKYARAFSCIKSDQGFDVEPNMKALKASSSLYEIWCYFKVLRVLIENFGYEVEECKRYKTYINFQDENADFKKIDKEKIVIFSKNSNRSGEAGALNGNGYEAIAKILNQYLLRPEVSKSINGLMITLKSEEYGDVSLGYNIQIFTKKVPMLFRDESGNLVDTDSSMEIRPDILLLKDKIIYTMDSKYHDFSENSMGMEQWYIDIIECIAFKYLFRMGKRCNFNIPELQGDDIRVGAGCILHPNIGANEDFVKSGNEDKCRKLYIEGKAENLYNKYVEKYMNVRSKNNIVHPDNYTAEDFKACFKEGNYDNRLAFCPLAPGERNLEYLLERILNRRLPKITW